MVEAQAISEEVSKKLHVAGVRATVAPAIAGGFAFERLLDRHLAIGPPSRIVALVPLRPHQSRAAEEAVDARGIMTDGIAIFLQRARSAREESPSQPVVSPAHRRAASAPRPPLASAVAMSSSLCRGPADSGVAGSGVGRFGRRARDPIVEGVELLLALLPIGWECLRDARRSCTRSAGRHRPPPRLPRTVACGLAFALVARGTRAGTMQTGT